MMKWQGQAGGAGLLNVMNALGEGLPTQAQSRFRIPNRSGFGGAKKEPYVICVS